VAAESPPRAIDEQTIVTIARNESVLLTQLGSFNYELWGQYGPLEAPQSEFIRTGRASIGADGIQVKEWEQTPAGAAKKRKKKPRAPRLLTAGFVAALTPDPGGIQSAYYKWEYGGSEFLGKVKCLIFDLEPKPAAGKGAFFGRILVSAEDLAIVQFSGTFKGSTAPSAYLHFVSSRVKTGPALWVPARIYIEEKALPRPVDGSYSLRARVNIWGYQPGAGLDSWRTSIRMEAEDGGAASSSTRTVPEPHTWYLQIEHLVISWMETHGILAPTGDAEQTVEAVVNGLQKASGISYGWPVSVRLLISSRLECFNIGDTLVASTGLLDAVRDEQELAVVVAPCLAHVLLDHHMDTRYGFPDFFLRDEAAVVADLHFQHSEIEVQAANNLALDMLLKSAYRSRLAQIGLGLRNLKASCDRGLALTSPNFGNQVFGCEASGPADRIIAATAAVHDAPSPTLGSRDVVDPWTGRIVLVQPHQEANPFTIWPLVLIPDDSVKAQREASPIGPAMWPRRPTPPAIQWS
jgi:hypothetical protein